MMGEKHKRDGFCNTEWKRAKTELTEDQALFGFMREPPTLQRIATISLAISLWTQPDVLKIFDDCSQQRHFVEDKDYNKIEKGVRKKLAKIGFPNSLKVKISNIIRPIGLQLDLCFLWSKAKYSFLHGLFKERGLIYWTMQGTIDMSKSLKTLINLRNQLNNRFDLFTLACHYCLDGCISDLWEKMPSDTSCSYEDYDDHLVVYWIAYLQNQLSTFLRKIKPADDVDIYDLNCSIHQNMVSLSIRQGNVNSLKYFWYKLTEQEKIDNIRKWLLLAVKHSVRPEYLYCMYGCGNEYINVVCFMLPHLSDQNELKEIFQNDSGGLLRSLFLCWPHNHFFLKTLNLMMMFNYLHVDNYSDVMECIIENMKEHQIGGDLFRKVWLSSSLKYKKNLITYITKWMSVFMVRRWDFEVFHVILSSSSSAEKKDIILRMINLVDEESYSKILSIIFTFVPNTMSADHEINLLKMEMLLNSEVVRKRLCYNPVQTAEQSWVAAITEYWDFEVFHVILNSSSSAEKKDIILRMISLVDEKNYSEILNIIFNFVPSTVSADHEINKLKIGILLNYKFVCKLIHYAGVQTAEKLVSLGFQALDKVQYFQKEEIDVGEIYEINVREIYHVLVIIGNKEYIEQFLRWCNESEDE